MTREQSLITGLMRLLGVFYGIRALDQAAGAVYLMQMQMAALPEEALEGFPNAWLLLAMTVGMYVGITVLVFVLAPRIARAIVPDSRPSESGEGGILWNETMIFCSGLVFFAWGLSRVAGAVASYGAGLIYEDIPHRSESMMGFAVLTLVIFCIGILLMVKFHRISAWMVRRKATSIDL